jgi:hypothetical protein
MRLLCLSVKQPRAGDHILLARRLLMFHVQPERSYIHNTWIRRQAIHLVLTVVAVATPSLKFCNLLRSLNVSVKVTNLDRLRRLLDELMRSPMPPPGDAGRSGYGLEKGAIRLSPFAPYGLRLTGL